MLPEDTARRLAFIRQLYLLGLEQSGQPEPMSATSILTLHDAAELFLELAVRHLNANASSNMQFMGYWEVIDAKLSGETFPMKSGMRRLNGARRVLKHDGILPAPEEVKSISSSVQAFFEEATPLIFDAEFEGISLAGLIAEGVVKSHIMAAEGAVSSGNYQEAFKDVALAHKELWLVERAKRGISIHSPGRNKNMLSQLDPTAQIFMSETSMLEKRLDMLTLGIDPKRYRIFSQLIPSVSEGYSGNVQFQFFQGPFKRNEKACRFCIDFVVDEAIRIQRFPDDWSPGLDLIDALASDVGESTQR